MAISNFVAGPPLAVAMGKVKHSPVRQRRAWRTGGEFQRDAIHSLSTRSSQRKLVRNTPEARCFRCRGVLAIQRFTSGDVSAANSAQWFPFDCSEMRSSNSASCVRVDPQQLKLKVSESSSPGLPSRQEVVGSKPNQVISIHSRCNQCSAKSIYSGDKFSLATGYIIANTQK